MKKLFDICMFVITYFLLRFLLLIGEILRVVFLILIFPFVVLLISVLVIVCAISGRRIHISLKQDEPSEKS